MYVSASPEELATIWLCSGENLGNLDSENPWALLLLSIFSLMIAGYFPSIRIGFANHPSENCTTLSDASERLHRYDH